MFTTASCSASLPPYCFGSCRALSALARLSPSVLSRSTTNGFGLLNMPFQVKSRLVTSSQKLAQPKQTKRQGGKKKRRRKRRLSLSPCLLVSLSPCLFVTAFPLL